MILPLFLATYRTDQGISIFMGHTQVTYDHIRLLSIVCFQCFTHRTGGAHARGMLLKHNFKCLPRVRIILDYQHVEIHEFVVARAGLKSRCSVRHPIPRLHKRE